MALTTQSPRMAFIAQYIVCRKKTYYDEPCLCVCVCGVKGYLFYGWHGKIRYVTAKVNAIHCGGWVGGSGVESVEMRSCFAYIFGWFIQILVFISIQMQIRNVYISIKKFDVS